jgi:hypothetical protein
MNNLAELSVLAGGFFNLAFAVFHLFFRRLFEWKKDLASLTFVNRAVMQILNLCLTFMFIVIAYVSFLHRQELMNTDMGMTLLIAFSLFWFFRMILQIIFFGLKNTLSLIFTLIFLIGGTLYLFPVLL